MEHNIQLATTQAITTSYAGEFAGKYISAALLTAKSLINGAVEIRPNVKFKEVISKLDLTSIIKDRSCDFSDTGTVTLLEKILEPKEMSVQLEICKKNYRNTWEAINMGFSANDNLAPDFTQFLITQILANVANATETSIWSGDADNAGEFGGFETIVTDGLATQPAAMEIAGTTLSASNIVAQLALGYTQITPAMYAQDDLQFLVPTSAIKFFIQAQAALGYGNLYYDGAAPPNFLGKPLIECPGMSANTYFVTRKSNMFFGTGLMDDSNSLQVIDRSITEGDDNVRFIMNYTAGTQIGNPEQLITYGLANGSN